MEIQYLGTAASEGWPALFCRCPACEKARRLKGKNIRTRSQALIDGSLLVDFPADTYLHVLRDGLDLSSVRRLLITHSHDDHFYPFDLYMRMEPYLHNPIEPRLHIYGNAAVIGLLREWAERFSQPGIFDSLVPHELNAFESVSFDGYRVTPLPANHMESEQALIYVIEKGGKTLLYGNDSGSFSEETWRALETFHFDCVSLDCTLGPVYGRFGHMGLANNGEVRRRMLLSGCARSDTVFISVHFSHNGGLTQEELEEKAGEIGFLAAYDGFRAEF